MQKFHYSLLLLIFANTLHPFWDKVPALFGPDEEAIAQKEDAKNSEEINKLLQEKVSNLSDKTFAQLMSVVNRLNDAKKKEVFIEQINTALEQELTDDTKKMALNTITAAGFLFGGIVFFPISNIVAGIAATGDFVTGITFGDNLIKYWACKKRKQLLEKKFK